MDQCVIRVDQSGSEWVRVGQSGSEWVRVDQSGTEWIRVGQSGSEHGLVLPISKNIFSFYANVKSRYNYMICIIYIYVFLD